MSAAEYTENDLRLAVAAYCRDLCAPDADCDPGHVFSDGYIDAMNRILRKSRRQIRRSRVLRVAASFFIVAALAFGAVMAFSEPARAAVGEWTKRVYNVILREYQDIFRPAYREALKEVEDLPADASPEERGKVARKTFAEIMSRSGIKGGDIVSVKGRLSLPVGFPRPVDGDYNDDVTIQMVGDDPEDLQILIIRGKYDDMGWMVMLPEGTEMEVRFTIEPETFKPVDPVILSPQQIEFKADCSMTKKYIANQTMITEITGTVSAIYEVDQVEDEIRKRAGSQMVNEYWWEESVKERVRFLVVEDDQGNKVGALTGIKNGPSVKTGDRIWMKGRSRDLGEDETMLPRYFLECDVVPPYYIFR